MKIQVRHFFYLSNILSLLRLILILPIVYYIQLNSETGNQILVVLGIIIIATDYFDGYFSRKFNQVTELGIILDPIADKISMAAVLIALVYYRGFSITLVLFLIYRDILIIVVGWFVNKKLKTPIMANFWGKLNTTIISITGLLFVMGIFNYLYTIFYFASFAILIVSSISYFSIGEKILFENKFSKYGFRLLIFFVTIVYFSTVPKIFENKELVKEAVSEDVLNASQLLSKYSPVLYFAKKEKYFPIAVEAFFDNSKFMKRSFCLLFDNEIKEYSSKIKLMTKYNSKEYYLKFNRNIFDNIEKIYNRVKNDYPMFVYSRMLKIEGNNNTNYVLQYWFFYFASEAGNTSIVWHECDWEMVMILLGEDYMPIKAGYSQHHYGEVRDWKNVEKENSHPIVYIAKGSHASYFSKGVYPTFLDNSKRLMFGYDECEMYYKFAEGDYQLRKIDNFTTWNNFKGFWGIPITTKLVSPKYRNPDDPNLTMWSNPIGWFNKYKQ